MPKCPQSVIESNYLTKLTPNLYLGQRTALRNYCELVLKSTLNVSNNTPKILLF